jgi:hypothetical protein
MSVEQLEATLLNLPLAERAAFANWFDAHRHELLGETADLGSAAQEELLLRLKELDEHPEILQSFEESDVESMIQQAADAHAKKSSARPR